MIALALVLTCMPADPETETFAGPGVQLKQTVVERDVTLELVRSDGTLLWRLAHAPGFFNATFSADGTWVATASTMHRAEVLVIDPKGVLASYGPLELLTEPERQHIANTSCGPAWFGGLKFDSTVLAVTVRQDVMRPPIYPKDKTPGLEVLIDVTTKKMSRRGR